jgi:DNA-directed RNA polymerase alpha subunit
VAPWEEPKGLWPNGELIPLELSGLKFYDMYIYNALRRAGIKYIEELKDKTYEWFISLPNIGKGRADKLQSCLYRTWGFKLKEE